MIALFTSVETMKTAKIPTGPYQPVLKETFVNSQ